MKRLRNILILVMLILLTGWLWGKWHLFPSIENLFAPKEVKIDPTPVVIQQVRSLAQLVTVTAYTEVAADTTAPASTIDKLKEILNPLSFNVHTNRTLVVIGKVTVHVGVDLSQLHTENIYIRDDSLSIQLPPAQVLDAILNPSGTD